MPKYQYTLQLRRGGTHRSEVDAETKDEALALIRAIHPDSEVVSIATANSFKMSDLIYAPLTALTSSKGQWVFGVVLFVIGFVVSFVLEMLIVQWLMSRAGVSRAYGRFALIPVLGGILLASMRRRITDFILGIRP